MFAFNQGATLSYQIQQGERFEIDIGELKRSAPALPAFTDNRCRST